MAKRLFSRKTYQKERKRKKGFFLLKLLVFGFLFFIFGSLILFIYYTKDLPRPEKFAERALVQSTKIYDRTGKVLLYEIYGEEKRTWVPLSEIPEHLKQIIIISEDANFYHHIGIDFKAILRSAWLNLKTGKLVYGGSTLSQQLIRSTFLGMEKTIKRKIREIFLTLELERRYSKDQILEWYLNQIPLGQNTYGVEAASQTYFQKSVSEISIEEAAVLAALIRAPSRLSPYGENKDELLALKNQLLDKMAKTGFLTNVEVKKIKESEISFSKITQPIKAPHFTFLVKSYLDSKYSKELLKEKGLKVYTTIDWHLQELAEKSITEKVERNKKFRSHNASLVAIDPKTGHILAMVGSRNWFAEPEPEGCIPGKNCLFEPYPNVTLRGRQPGSAFKPFVYAVAFKKGYDDEYVVIDEETNFGIWGGKPYIPRNYDGLFRGPVTLRQALAQSLNIPSVKVLAFLAGLEDSIKMAQNFGFTTLSQPPHYYGLAIVLGGGELKLLDMVSAYGVFATKGLQVPPVFIQKIEDAHGNTIEENKKTPRRILEKDIARLINDILSDNNARAPIFGLTSAMHIEGYQVAAKTGTTQDFKDGWIVGYTPSIVVGVWVGNNDNTPMWNAPGVVVAGPIWKTFMQEVLIKFPEKSF